MELRIEDVTDGVLTEDALVILKSGHAFVLNDWWVACDADGDPMEDEFGTFRIVGETSDGNIILFDNDDVETVVLGDVDSETVVASRDEYTGDADPEDNPETISPTAPGVATAPEGYSPFPGMKVYAIDEHGERVNIPDGAQDAIDAMFGALGGLRSSSLSDVLSSLGGRDFFGGRGPAEAPEASFLDDEARKSVESFGRDSRILR